MGLMLAEPGYHTRCYVEWEEYPRDVLIAAQRAGYMAPAPIWSDLTTFDAKPLAGAIDTLCAGYPCQPFSAAGKRLGEDDERHLWPHVARVITELGDHLEWVFLENVSGHVSLGLEAVLRALWDMGFAPASGLFTAAETGAKHKRERIFVVAHKPRRGRRECEDAAQPGRGGHPDGGGGAVAHSDGQHDDRRGHVWAGWGAEPAERGWPVANACGRRQGGPGTWQDEQPRGAEAVSTGDPVADADGGDARAERERSGGQQRLQPEGGGTGGSDVDHANGARSAQAGRWPDGRHDERSGQQVPCDGQRTMDNPIGDGRTPRRDHDGCDERVEPDAVGGQLAHASQPGSQGIVAGLHHPPRWQKPHGYAGLPGRAGLFPPRPNDADAWSAVIRSTPHRAPSVARKDALAACIRAAAMVSPDDAAALVAGAAGMDDAQFVAAVEGRAGNVVGETQAFTIFRLLADGVAGRPRALRLLGNGVVPIQAAYAWRTLSAAHGLWPVDMEATGTTQAME